MKPPRNYVHEQKENNMNQAHIARLIQTHVKTRSRNVYVKNNQRNIFLETSNLTIASHMSIAQPYQTIILNNS